MAGGNPNMKGALYGLAAFALYSTQDVVVKQLGATYSPVQIVFFSVMLGFPLAMMMVVRDATPGTLRPVHPWWMLVRAVSGLIAALSAFFAFTLLPLAQVYAIIFAMPLFITVLSIPLLGERVRLRRWVAVIVGLVGVLVVLRPGSTELGLGHLAALSCAISGALNSTVVRKVGQEERGVVLVLYPMLLNFLVLGAALPLVYVPMPITDLGLSALIAVLSFAAMMLLVQAYKSAEAVIVAPMQYSQIIWATVFGVLLFSEWPDQATMLGAGIIVASGLYILLRESGSNASENQPVLRNRSRVGTANTLRVGPILRANRASNSPEKK